MSPVQLSFRADRAQSARAPRGVAPPSSGGGTGPLCRPPAPALGTSQELIQFPFGLFAAVIAALLQLADESWGANGSSWVRRTSGLAVGTTSIGHRAFFIRRI